MNINLRNLFGPNHDDMINCKKRYLVVKGSRGSGKSTTVYRMIILRMLYYWKKYKICPSILIVRQWACTHNNSTYIEVQKAIDALNVNGLFKKTKSPMMYIHIPSGAQIIFKGLDEGTKITGINAPTPLTWIICEEAFELKSEEEFDKMNMSIRGIIPECLFYQTILMFNPWSDKHWLKKRFFDVIDDDVLAITKTYRDNKFLDVQFVKDMEKLKINNPKKYRIVGDGEFGIAEGMVFENWVVQPFDYQKMLTAKSYLNTNKFKECYGLDFGWTDPSTVIGSLVNEDTKELFIYGEIYESNLTIANLAKKIKSRGWENKQIMCDSANPREIQLLKSEGINGAKSAYKGPNSIMAGIKLLQDYKIIIHPNCKHTIEEFSLYTWETDKTSGKFLDTPIDDHNHCFIGSTLIKTNTGLKQIKDITTNDRVLTSSGYKKVNKLFNNGYRKVSDYTIFTDSGVFKLTGTPEHKIKIGDNEWKELSKLSKMDKLYSISMEENIKCMLAKNILETLVNDYTELYGNSITEKYLKNITSIIKIIINLTTTSKIWNVFHVKNIVKYMNQLKKKILNLLKIEKTIWIKFVTLLKYGMQAIKELNGIENMQKNVISGNHSCSRIIANNVEPNILPINQAIQNSALINVNQNGEENMESITLKKYANDADVHLLQVNTAEINTVLVTAVVEENERIEQVYDIEVDECHEYYANGILVHNCIDSLRYSMLTQKATFY